MTRDLRRINRASAIETPQESESSALHRCIAAGNAHMACALKRLASAIAIPARVPLHHQSAPRGVGLRSEEEGAGMFARCAGGGDAALLECRSSCDHRLQATCCEGFSAGFSAVSPRTVSSVRHELPGLVSAREIRDVPSTQIEQSGCCQGRRIAFVAYHNNGSIRI